MTGVQMLEQAKSTPRRQAPAAHRVRRHRRRDPGDQRRRPRLLPAEAVGPAEERLYPVLDDLLGDWRQAHPPDTGEVRVVGHRWSERSHEVKTFLTRNHVPYQWLDVDRDDEAAGCSTSPAPARRPAARARAGRRAAARPSNLELAARSGCAPGRAAAVRPVHRRRRPGRARRRGVRRLRGAAHRRGGEGGARRPGRPERVDRELPRLPEGPVRGRPRPPRRRQASRFGAEMLLARDVVGLETRGPVRAVRFGDSGELEARAVLVASGVSYRRLEGPGGGARRPRRLLRLLGERGEPVQGDDVYVVGGANSAGQAALNFARYAKRVVMVVRGAALEDTMSLYLVAQIRATDNIEVRLRSSVVAARGDGHLRAITLCEQGSRRRRCPRAGCSSTSAPRRAPTGSARASPATRGLRPHRPGPAGVVVDDAVAAGPRAVRPRDQRARRLRAGDVRLDSMKRVASAVGEGAMTVYLVHRYLAST
jgi:thioredoxin reductase (NADPH)